MNRLNKRGFNRNWGLIQPLAPAGTLRFLELIQQAVAPAALFCWLLIFQVVPWRFSMSFLTTAIAAIGALAILFFPARALFVYTAGVYKTAQHSVARSSAVIFWCYWPCCRFVACILAIGFGIALGNHLWYNNFRPYEAYYQLQSYDNVDPYSVTGTRIQDAGIVRFNQSVGVDRARGGCIVNGHTYCVAPILQGGKTDVNKKQTKSGKQDLFMVGIDCCNCPVTDFRCGDYDDPVGTLGGMRLLDEDQRKMFRLAADKWAADWHKETRHDIFFKWVNDPIAAWQHLWKRGVHLSILACCGAILLSFLFMVLLNGVIRLLKDLNIAVPLDDGPPLSPGIGFGNRDETKPFVPNQYQSYLHQKESPDVEETNFVVL